MSKNIPKAICIFGASFMLDQLRQLENLIEGVQTSKDIEYIHQMRVASRRLRNGLDLFGECLPGKKSKIWFDDVRTITHALGNARDLDIQIAVLSSLYNDDLSAKYKPGYIRLLLRLKQRRTKAQKKVNKTINRLQEDETLSSLTAYLTKLVAKSTKPPELAASLYKKSNNSIQGELTAFLSYQPFIWEAENVEKLHAMRIAGKHLRYTMEIFAPLYNGALDPFIILMKNIQDILGEIHDNDVWVLWLPKFIKKEQQRIEDYFGNTEPLNRLLPGLQHLMADRQKSREQAYQTFLSTWESIAAENAWHALGTLISTPPELKPEPEEDTRSPEPDQVGEEFSGAEEINEEPPFTEIPLPED